MKLTIAGMKVVLKMLVNQNVETRSLNEVELDQVIAGLTYIKEARQLYGTKFVDNIELEIVNDRAFPEEVR